MNIIAKLASTVLSCIVLTGAAFAQTTYRQSYPLGDPTTLDGLSLNLTTHAPTDAQLQQVVDAGFKFVRVDFTWAGIERTKGVYTWTDMDAMMAKLQAKGLRTMAVLAYSNALYTTTGAPNTPESRAGFAAFAKACAARYAHQGVIWEIFNEPNLAGWWPNPLPADYALLANATTAAIRSVSADEWIVGLSTQTPAGWNNDYVNGALDGGVLENNGLDALAFHPYTSAIPETMAGQWDTARTMLALRQPANHPVALIAGEVGYSRSWTGLNESLQATYLVRTILFSLSQGLPFVNLFSYDDAPTADDWHAHLGIVTSGTNVPYQAYGAVKRLTTALKGYRFTKRLTLASANDYCLLFSKTTDANDCKVVVWTTDAAHAVKVPSSATSFVATTLANGTGGSAAATSAGLTVTASGEPILYASQGTNPLLALAGSWAKLPANLTLSTKADAMSQLGSLIVSPAWAGAPAGTTLKIEDVPAAVPGYNRPAYTVTLGNLSTLTLNSAAVQTVFNSLGALQDGMNAGRTLKITVQLPDGSSALQLATVARKQPLTLIPTTPSNWNLSLRIENPTGATFNGTLVAQSGLVSVPVPCVLAQGETFKQINFSALSSALIGSSVNYSLFDSSGNVVDPSAPTIGSADSTVFRAPNMVAGGGYGVTLSGVATVSGSANISYGVASAPGAWGFLNGGACISVDYTFGANGIKYFTMGGPTSLTGQTFAKTPISIGMWMYGDNSRNVIRTQFIDGAGQVFQFTYGAIDWSGWKWVSIPIAGNLTNHWGGANDGVVRGAMRCLFPFSVDSNYMGSAGRISVMGLTIVGQK